MNTLLNVTLPDTANWLIQAVATVLEMLAAIIVAYGAIRAFYLVVLEPLLRRYERDAYGHARIGLGQMLVVGLEFELGSDLLRTAVQPTWNHIGIVAAIVVIRSALNYLLEQDIERLERRISRNQADGQEESAA